MRPLAQLGTPQQNPAPPESGSQGLKTGAPRLTRWAGLQIGDEAPDVGPAALSGAWEATQQLLDRRLISAGHDVSDGGLATALLEMAFAGNCGLQVRPAAALPCAGGGQDPCVLGLLPAQQLRTVLNTTSAVAGADCW